MPAKKSSIGIQTAKREEKNGGAFFLDLDTVEAWINSLPRGSAGKTAQQLFSALQDINKIKLDFEDRVDYLELIREPLFYTMSIMEKHFVGGNFPLIKKQKKIASLSKEFCLLMMMGYVIAIEELLEEYNVRRDKQILGFLIHRAVSYINHYILISYQIYMIVPDDIWDKLHKLYLFAEDNKVSNIKVSDDQFQYINKTTVSEEYVRSLLLASASPYHMRSNEVGNTYINIERWMDSVRIFPLDEKMNAKYYFVTDLNSEVPILNSQELKGRRKKNLRIIVVDELIRKIDHELQGSEMVSSQTLLSANLGDATLSHDLLARLKNYWTSKSEPSTNKSKVRKKVKMVVGISATYNLAQEITERSNKDDNQLFAQLTDFDEMAVTNIKVSKENKDIDSDSAEDSGLFNIEASKSYIQNGDWLLTNQAKEEYCLQCSGDCIQQLQVGEVVGVRHLSGNKKDGFILGIISWMRVYGDSLIKLGVKLVSTSAIAIEVRSIIDDVKSEQCQRAFLLPLIKELGQPSSIFGLPATYRSGVSLVISIFRKEIPVRLTHKLLDSGLYCQYQVEGLTKKIVRKKMKPQARKKSSGTGFEDVWDSI